MERIQIEDREFEILLENDQIGKRTRLIAIQIGLDYEGRCPVFIGILNGSFIFMADLMKELSIPCEASFIRVSSYDGARSSGAVREVIGLTAELKDRDVIIVEDIVDTGLTLSYLLDELKKHQPASLAVCSLLLKPAALKVKTDTPKYVGFEIGNEFVVGYGLDYNGLGRNLKHIYKAISAL